MSAEPAEVAKKVLHWTQTPEGKARLGALMKLAHKRKKGPWMSPKGLKSKRAKYVTTRKYRQRVTTEANGRSEAEMNSGALHFLERYMKTRPAGKPVDPHELNVFHAYFILRGEE